jgi:excisionase family DNA binding protein
MKIISQKNSSCNESLKMLPNTSGSLKISLEEKDWLTSDEAAAYLRISVETLRNLTSTNQVPYFKFFKSNRYLKNELDSLIVRARKGQKNGT